MRYYEEEVSTEIDPNRNYTPRELDQIATQMLKEDANSVDPETGKRKGTKGDNAFYLTAHLGYLQMEKRRREILNINGVPEENLRMESAPGRKGNDQLPMFNRTHPEGRKVNSEEQRKTNGASYYR